MGDIKFAPNAKIEKGSRVILHAMISKTGEVTNLEFVGGNPEFLPRAAESVRKWKYKPYLLNGEPVEVDSTIEVNIYPPGLY